MIQSFFKKDLLSSFYLNSVKILNYKKITKKARHGFYNIKQLYLHRIYFKE